MGKLKFLLILLFFVTSLKLFAQTDSLFLSEKASKEFVKMKVDSLIAKYGFNDTAKLMISTYIRKERKYIAYLGVSLASLPVGILIFKSLEPDINSVLDFQLRLAKIILSETMIVSSLPSFIISLVLKIRVDRQSLYRELKRYHNFKKLSKKSNRLMYNLGVD